MKIGGGDEIDAYVIYQFGSSIGSLNFMSKQCARFVSITIYKGGLRHKIFNVGN
jgi:hypothetical protein